MTQVRQIGLRWSNAFLILGHKMVLVDTGCPEDEKTILNAISDAGRQVSELSLILHTHIHIDHCGCTATLKQKSNALVAIHRSESQTFLERKNAPIIPINWLGKILTPTIRDGHKPCEIDILIDDALDLQPYGIDGKAIATPGHTPGSISIFLDSGEVIAGDLLGGGRLLGLFQPERPRYHHWYSDLDAAKKSIAQIMNIKPVKIYAGHGGPLDGQSAIRYFSRKENAPIL
jgi:glyoxylase-like metal-dependent hydrolase (beta-lactamase superfamily II)